MGAEKGELEDTRRVRAYAVTRRELASAPSKTLKPGRVAEGGDQLSAIRTISHLVNVREHISEHPLLACIGRFVFGQLAALQPHRRVARSAPLEREK